MFSIDGSFYPDKSSLVAAHFIITYKKKIGSGNFISIVALQFRNPFTVELYRVLIILKVIKYILKKIKASIIAYNIKIISDCAVVINFLHYTSYSITNRAKLYQIK